MKHWEEDHPKAGIMSRKRASILLAARKMFLCLGYEGASMEAIAAEANVSIMTLYRHARSKDELFAAVIAGACEPGDGSEQVDLDRIMEMPLGQILVYAGIECQERLAHPDTLALLRTVVASSERFPNLGKAAYQGIVGHWEEIVCEVLARKEESQHLDDDARSELSREFVDGLFGADGFRVVLGLGSPSAEERDRRARRSTDRLLRAIGVQGREGSG